MVNLEWQLAKEWIRSTGAVPIASKIHSECDLIDFVQALRDGVILCEVANHIRRGAVRDFTRTTHMSAFFCNKNINGFLKACEAIFFITKEDLFRPRDLYEVTDFAKVLNTLSKLSQSPLATQMGLKEFPPKNHVQEVRKHYDEDDIYSKLEGAVVDTNSIHENNEDIYDPVTVEESEKIYDDIIKCSRESQALLAKEPDKRSHVVNEILQTEENYVNALGVMIEFFIRPLKTFLTKDDKRIIFMNTETLFDIHSRFLSSLKLRGFKLNLQSFVDFSNDFLEYATYCSRMQEAQHHVSQLCKDAKFSQIVEECQRKSKRKFPLHEQLIVPFQRILKYPLLLRGLLKDTPIDHPERSKTEEALDVMEDIAKYINLHKKDDEMQKKISSIEASVKDDLCQNDRMHDNGRFINDDEVQVRFTSDESKKGWSKRYAFLFDKCLLLCKIKGETYEIKEKFDLKRFKVDGEIPNSGKGKFVYCWKMQAQTKDDEVSEIINCIMATTSRALKEAWVLKLQMCIDAVQLSRLTRVGRHKFELTTFTNVVRCSVCTKLLCGLISQGYKCGVCHFNVHYDCIEKCPDCIQRGARKQRQGFDHMRYEDHHDVSQRAMMNSQDIAPPNLKTALRSWPWFVGLMNRHTAAEKLQHQRTGTFLVRESENSKGHYVLSLLYNNEAKHIKIKYSGNCYSISDLYQFRSIPDLIEYFKRNSLEESFPCVPISLTDSIPARDVVVARYAYNARNQQELSLRRDARISVIKREGNWWYGELDGNFGFFPKTYVEEVPTMS